MIKVDRSVGARWSALRHRFQTPLLAVMGGLVIGGLIMWLAGYDPIEAYSAMLNGAFAGRRLINLVSMLNRAGPIVGMGLAAAIAFRAGFFNIGGEGQLVLGSVIAALVTLYLPLPDALRIPFVFIAAAGVAGGYAWLAAYFQFRFQVPLLISTLLLNYPARFLASYLVSYPFRDIPSGMNQSELIPEAARLPKLIAGTQLHLGVIIIFALVLLAVFVLYRTVAGYEVRMLGLNARFAQYGGISLRATGYRVMFLSGALAGVVGAIEVLAIHYRYVDGMLVTPLYAWTGIMAALLANTNPIGVLVAGLFFSAVQTGGAGMERGAEVPRELARVIQAIIIMLVAASAGFRTSREHGEEATRG